MLSELREMLSYQPDPLTFEGVLGVLAKNTGHDDFEVALDYAEQHMASWDDKHRRLDYSFDDYSHLAEPWVRLVRYLDFSISNYKQRSKVDGLAKALAETPHGSNLLGVELRFRPIGDEGAKIIAESPYMSNLTMLGLGGCRLGSHGFIAIANSPYMANLQSLDLWGNIFGVVGVNAIAQSPYMSNLQWLRLNRSPLGKVGVGAIANSPYLREEVRAQYRPETYGPQSEAVYSTNEIEL